MSSVEGDSDIQYMDVREFRTSGLLQELNRLFLHPLGLALEVRQDPVDGTESLGHIWDYRWESDGGIVYGDGVIDPEKVESVSALAKAKADARLDRYGWVIQPVSEDD